MLLKIEDSTMVLPDFGFDPITTLQTVAAEKCTVLYGVPTMFVAELAEPSFEDYDLSTLRTGIMAGSPCPEDVMKRVISDMHMGEVTIAYGMTETSPVSFQSSTDDSVALRVSTVGKVHPHVQVKIIDPRVDDEFPLPDYETPGSAGMDLRAIMDKNLQLSPGETVLIPTGIPYILVIQQWQQYYYHVLV